MSEATQWVIATIVALALVALVGLARGGIGDDDRVPDVEHVVVVTG
jgi:hypothetical protein